MPFTFRVRAVLASCFVCVAGLLPQAAFAFDDPTGGKPFFPWVWEDQIKPTAREALDVDGFPILLTTAVLTMGVRQYDYDIKQEYGDNRRMPKRISGVASMLGSGYPGALLTLSLIAWDQPQGLRMARAVILTSASQFTIATIAQRERPNHGPRSFPSGHTSTTFAVATSLAYSYGPWIGVPALAVATYVGFARVADNAHWMSDTVAAAGLGIFWARASAQAGMEKGSLTPKNTMTPAVVPGGLVLNFSREF